MWKVYGIMFLVVVVIAVFWVIGVDNMKKNRPKYKNGDLDRPDFSYEEDDLYYNTDEEDEDQ